MASSVQERQSSVGEQSLRVMETIKTVESTSLSSNRYQHLNRRLNHISEGRLRQSAVSATPDAPLPSKEESSTVLYLAYGSNLCAETFQGNRGIRPLAAINVVVPSLVMTFDLPGIPYSEPCFANTRYRKPQTSSLSSDASRPNLKESEADKESSFLLSNSNSTLHGHEKPKYHKDRWPLGLVGVVYEVTPSDYAHIIATEGGGASYQDIAIQCYPLPENTEHVPEFPISTPFLAHTLFAPANPPSGENNLVFVPVKNEGDLGKSKEVQRIGRLTRPDPSYAQPSARYLKLITDGAAEHDFPPDYTTYLHSIRPYTITSTKQRLGQFFLLLTWGPIIAWLFALARLFEKLGNGKSPPWLIWLLGKVFEGVWMSYDKFFRNLFGDGERTVKGGGGDEEEEQLIPSDRKCELLV
jgi:hypothetical protein